MFMFKLSILILVLIVVGLNSFVVYVVEED